MSQRDPKDDTVVAAAVKVKADRRTTLRTFPKATEMTLLRLGTVMCNSTRSQTITAQLSGR